MNISNNTSSITAHQTFLNNNANNIANVNTDRFIPNSTIITDDTKSVSAVSRKSEDTGSMQSQTDLAKEIPDQIIIDNATSVNVSAIKTQDEMFGSLLDIKA